MTLTELRSYISIQLSNGAASMATNAIETALNTIVDLVLAATPLAGNLAGVISSTTVDPGTPTVAQVYITTTAGSYTHFLSALATPIVVAATDALCIMTFNTGTGYWVATHVPWQTLTASPTGGVGYATGAGGTVTQITSKATGVTLNKPCGNIVMHNASLAAAASVSFTLTNSQIAAGDIPIPAVKSSGAAVGKYTAAVTATAAGSCEITVTNLGGTASEAVVINFGILKGVAA